MLRRTGRFAIGAVALTAFLLVGGIVYLIPAITMGVWFPKLTFFAAIGAAMGVYAIFDKLNLIPDDPDKIITLSLSTRPPADQPWVSSDFEKR